MLTLLAHLVHSISSTDRPHAAPRVTVPSRSVTSGCVSLSGAFSSALQLNFQNVFKGTLPCPKPTPMENTRKNLKNSKTPKTLDLGVSLQGTPSHTRPACWPVASSHVSAPPRGRACMSAAVLCGPVSNSHTHTQNSAIRAGPNRCRNDVPFVSEIGFFLLAGSVRENFVIYQLPSNLHTAHGSASRLSQSGAPFHRRPWTGGVRGCRLLACLR